LKCKESLYFLCKAIIGFKDFCPDLHGLMCSYAQNRLVRRHLELWPRDHYKTSIYSIGLPIYEYILDQNVTILIAGSTATNASRRLRRIQRVFESNALFRWLFPDLIPPDFNKRWNEQESLCPRTEDRVEPTFDTIGVGGKSTGRHYMIKITDDMVDETCLDSLGMPSQVAMDSVRQWFDYSEYLLESEHSSRDIVVGTRWAKDDPYVAIMKDARFVTERHSADGGCCHIHPAGVPIFPSDCYRCSDSTHSDKGHKIVGFSLNHLAALQKKDPYKYALQMRNDPVDPTITDFRREWLQEFEWIGGGDGVRLGPSLADRRNEILLGSCNTYLIVDPAFTKRTRNDPTGCLVGAVSPRGHLLILDAVEMRLEPLPLLEAIYDKWKSWRPFEVLVEDVAGQRLIIPFLKDRGERDGVYIRIRGVRPGGNIPKLARIRGLVGPFSRGEVWCAPGLMQFTTQYASFPSNRDHLLDCLSYLYSDGRRPLSDDEQLEQDEQDDLLFRAMNKVTGY
jgi:hypothetical protein